MSQRPTNATIAGFALLSGYRKHRCSCLITLRDVPFGLRPSASSNASLTATQRIQPSHPRPGHPVQQQKCNHCSDQRRHRLALAICSSVAPAALAIASVFANPAAATTARTSAHVATRINSLTLSTEMSALALPPGRQTSPNATQVESARKSRRSVIAAPFGRRAGD